MPAAVAPSASGARDVEARRDPAGGHDGLEAQGREERDGGAGGNAPVPEGLAERLRRGVARAGGATRLDAHPRRPARARDVDVLDPDLAQALARLPGRCRSRSP